MEVDDGRQGGRQQQVGAPTSADVPVDAEASGGAPGWRCGGAAGAQTGGFGWYPSGAAGVQTDGPGWRGIFSRAGRARCRSASARLGLDG